MTVPTNTIFAEMALDHLMMIDADSAMPEMRLHCHFARTFLELALGEHHWQSVSSLTFAPQIEHIRS